MKRRLEPRQRAAVWVGQAENAVINGEQEPPAYPDVGGELFGELGQDTRILATEPIPTVPGDHGGERLAVALVEVGKCCAVHNNERGVAGRLLDQRR